MQNKRRLILWIAILILTISLPGCRRYEGRRDSHPSGQTVPLHISGPSTRYALGLHLDYLEDPSGILTLSDVTSLPYSRRFVPARDLYPNFGLTRSAYWIRVPLRSELDRSTEWLLEIGPYFLDAVDVYVPHPDGRIAHVHMGDRAPFHAREFLHRHFITDLALTPEVEQTVYLRVRDQSRVRLKMILWEPDRFESTEGLWNLGYGVLYGATLMMGVYSLLVFLMIKERLYLYFAFHTLISLLIFLSWNGFGYQYLWPDSVRWHNVATPSLFALGVGIHFIFTAEYLRVRRYSLLLYRLMHVGAGLALTLLLGLMATGNPVFQSLFFILSIPTVLLFGAIACYAYRKREPAARPYLLIWGLYNLSFLITGSSELGLVPSTPWTDHISQITFALTLPFLSVRLADRLNASRRKREAARRDALRISLEKEQLMREQNVLLEREVETRTDALREAKAEIERSHEMLQAVFDNLDMMIYVADIETHEVLFVNDYTRAQFGDIEGQTCRRAFQRGQTGPCEFCTHDHLLEEGRPESAHRWEFQNTVTGRWYQIQDQAFRWPDGRLVRIEVATDITDLEQAEQQVLDQQRHLARLEERKRIGDTLHDDLGQVMSYINVQAQTALGLLAQEQFPEAEDVLNRLVDVIREAHSDIREYILGARESRSPAGFFEALTDHVKMLRQRYELRIDLQLPDDHPSPPFPPEAEAPVLAIVREALTNVAKHANVDAAYVIIQTRERATRITIQDRGDGFRPLTASETSKRFGLKMMRERAERIGGTLDVISHPGSGTLVTLQIPRTLNGLDRESHRLDEDLRLLLVDDHPLFLEGLRYMLTTQGAQVVGIANDGLEAVAMVAKHRPDIVLMDVEMPKCGGIEATQQITARFPDIKVVMLTVIVDDEVLFDALKAGASGYLLKNLDSETLFSMLSDLMHDQVIIAPRLASRVLDEFAERNPDAYRDGRRTGPALTGEPTGDLTPRQLEVLQTVASGLTYKEVGNKLYISERTVKYHMGEILKRLQIKTRAQAIAYATQQGWIAERDE